MPRCISFLFTRLSPGWHYTDSMKPMARLNRRSGVILEASPYNACLRAFRASLHESVRQKEEPKRPRTVIAFIMIPDIHARVTRDPKVFRCWAVKLYINMMTGFQSNIHENCRAKQPSTTMVAFHLFYRERNVCLNVKVCRRLIANYTDNE